MEFLAEFFEKNLWSLLGLIVTAVVIVVTMKVTLKSIEKDVAQIKQDVRDQKDKDQEHDIRFAEIDGELNLLKQEQKNLREYAIQGIEEVKQAIDKLRDYLISNEK